MCPGVTAFFESKQGITPATLTLEERAGISLRVNKVTRKGLTHTVLRGWGGFYTGSRFLWEVCVLGKGGELLYFCVCLFVRSCGY